MLHLLRNILGKKTDYKALIGRGAMIIDVRTPSEYSAGHIKGSVNVPVNDIKARAQEIKNKNKPVITVCMSGARSGMARSVLVVAGVETYNGGSWRSLQNKLR
ncbi:rhodanese-like domain-containing protein [Chitinophagaceae bacterium MMS25-I14]